MANLTTPRQINERLCAGFDQAYHDSLGRLASYAFGTGSGQEGEASGGGVFPDYWDTIPSMAEIGRSKRMLDVAATALAKMAYSEVEPEFPQLDKYSGEIRKQFWLTRARQGEWRDQMALALLEADQLGVGFVKIGLKDNTKTGRQFVDMLHVPATQVIWDRHYRHPSRSRWCCFLTYMSVEDARARFDKKTVEPYIINMYENGNRWPLQGVRVFEYHDIGFSAKQDPTCAILLGDLDREPIERYANPFGVLPWAHGSANFVPGLAKPYGRIFAVMELNEALNDADARQRNDVRNGAGHRVIDAMQVDDQDLRRAESGKGRAFIRRTNPNPGIKVIEEVAPSPVDANLLQWRSFLEERFNTAAGTNDLEQGNFSDTKRTATENELLVTQSGTRASWQTRQTLQFYQRCVETVIEVARAGDTDPVLLDIFGTNVEFNTPGYPESAIAGPLEEPSRVLIGEDTLTVKDQNSERAQRMAIMQALAGLPGIDPVWYAEEMLKAAGFDPAEAMAQQQVPGMDAALPGMGMPPASGGIAPIAPEGPKNAFAQGV